MSKLLRCFRCRILWAALVSLLNTHSAGAAVFSTPLDMSNWRMEASQFRCSLSQQIPDYGVAAFEHGAGESLRFVLDSSQPALLGENTRIIAEPPPWLAGEASRELGKGIVVKGSGQLRATGKQAKEILVTLYEGRTPAITNDRWYGTEKRVKVLISAVNFQAAYSDYMGCVAQLLPVNFRQIARSAVLFPSAQWRLSDATKKRLDLIALYVNADSSVKSVFVDGHSDNFGRRLANRDLSRQRAEEVTRYLSEVGVNEEMVTTRYHGERYPVVENNLAANRARNRRVTIRLERD